MSRKPPLNESQEAHRSIVRRARHDEGGALTDLALRSKAYWGYDDTFMISVRPALTISDDYIASNHVFVHDDDSAIRGFGSLAVIDNELFLDNLFVEPKSIGTGVGTKLWNYAIVITHTNDYPSFRIESDPFAEPFYLAKGAARIGETISSATGRSLPLLRYTIDGRAPF